MDTLLNEFTRKLEAGLNADEEIQRRLEGFKTFSGAPDGHYLRARREGSSAVARAVRCYPFGGESLLADCHIAGIAVTGGAADDGFVISVADGTFSVTGAEWKNPCITMTLSRELFRKAVLGRYRWMWLIGTGEVTVTYAEGLPHSDWITILEILVVMQELVEFDTGLLEKFEKWE